MTILLCKLLSKVLLFGPVQWFPGKRYFFDVCNCVIQKKSCSFISSGVLLKHKSTNFTLVEATFVWKERAICQSLIPNGLYTYFLEEEGRHYQLTPSKILILSLRKMLQMILQLIRNRNVQTIIRYLLLLWNNKQTAWRDSSGINNSSLNC